MLRRRPLVVALLATVGASPLACSLLVASELDGKSSASGASSDAGVPEASPDALSDAEQEPEVDQPDAPDVDDASDADQDTGCAGCQDTCCNGVCTDTSTDGDNCGACGDACPAGRKCVAGACESGFVSMSSDGFESPRFRACAVWTGDEMFVWGGTNEAGEPLDTGGAYDPMTDTWREVSMDMPPAAREQPTCVAFEGKVFVWGGAAAPAPGEQPLLLLDGSIWNPQTNGWRSIGTPTGLEPRIRATAVWTGAQVLIWGGEDMTEHQVATGARYDPSQDTWTLLDTGNKPPLCKRQASVWTGSDLFVFGGRDDAGGQVGDKFHVYSLALDQWSEVTAVGGPTPRSNAFAVWTGSEMIVWGGLGGDGVGLVDGAAFSPSTGEWAPISQVAPPTARGRQEFRSGWNAWTGEEMLVVGGSDANGIRADLARFDPDAPDATAWSGPVAWDPPYAHEQGVGVWTGREFILWGGSDGSDPVVGGTRWMP